MYLTQIWNDDYGNPRMTRQYWKIWIKQQQWLCFFTRNKYPWQNKDFFYNRNHLLIQVVYTVVHCNMVVQSVSILKYNTKNSNNWSISKPRPTKGHWPRPFPFDPLEPARRGSRGVGSNTSGGSVGDPMAANEFPAGHFWFSTVLP